MCGIYASVSTAGYQRPDSSLETHLHSRGPDSSGIEEREICGKDGKSYYFHFFSTVLALRGDCITPQPLTDTSSRSVLCWNGEAWQIDQMGIEGNDGGVIFQKLLQASRGSSKIASVPRVLGVIRAIHGPFAFIYLDKEHDLLYFSRDCLGRRSLVYSVGSATDIIQFSSIAVSKSKEVESDGIYMLDCTESLTDIPIDFLRVLADESCFHIYRFSWTYGDSEKTSVCHQSSVYRIIGLLEP